MIAKLNEIASNAELLASIVVKKTEHGFHTGIVHKNRDTRNINILHLVFHQIVENDDFSSLCSAYWDSDDFYVIPVSFEPELQIQLAAICRRIYDAKDDSKFKYGLLYDGTTYFSSDLQIIIGEKCSGLTCATFVLAAFSRIGISLVDIQNWRTRPDDKTWHEEILVVLKKHCQDREHIKLVETEVGCIRVTPTEVAASLNFEIKPASYEEIETKGKQIAELIS